MVLLSKSRQEESAVMSFFTSSVVCAALSVTLSLKNNSTTTYDEFHPSLYDENDFTSYKKDFEFFLFTCKNWVALWVVLLPLHGSLI